jgi:ribosomal protein S18 acetylase RimI-like enzyme
MKEKIAAYDIARARWPEDVELARELLRNYGQYLAASPVGAAGLCLADYEAELQSLPGKYAGNAADMLLARVKNQGAACVAVTERVLKDGTLSTEMKRLWVEPNFRGLGLGRGLVHEAIEWAKARGCGAVVLDTVNEAMPKAAELYRSMGFAETGRFNENPISGVRFYILKLPTTPETNED